MTYSFPLSSTTFPMMVRGVFLTSSIVNMIGSYLLLLEVE